MLPKVYQLSKYGPIFKGGIEKEAENIKRDLLDHGYFVYMLYFSSKFDTPKVIKSPNLESIVCKTFFSLFNQPLSFRYFFEILKIKKKDIVHVNLPNYLAMIACCLLPANTKIIVFWHSDVIGRRLLKLFLYPFEKILLKRSNKILCQSHEYANHSFSLKSYMKKVEILPIASDGVVKKKNRSITNNKDIYLLNVGRLVQYKNQDFLVDVMKLLPDRFKLEIVGYGELKNKILNTINNSGLNDRIKITSCLTKEQLHKKYLEADLFVLSSNSRAEAYGVVLVEALSYSLPIVSLKIPGSGVSFVNKDEYTGLHSISNDPLEMATKIMRITKDNKSYRKFSLNAINHYYNHFTPKAHRAKLIKIYKDL